VRSPYFDATSSMSDEQIQIIGIPLRSSTHLRPVRLIGIVIALAVLADSAPAQSPTTPSHRPSLGAWAGASFYSPGGRFLGGETGRDLFLAGVRAEWMLASGQHLALAATVDAIPLAVVTRNPYYTDRIVGFAVSRRGERVAILEQTGRGPVYGVGASPLGLELFGPRVHAVRPYLAAAAGFLWFRRNTPEPEARRLNATFEVGAGLRVARGEHHALLLGWKFHHLSNAWTAPYNPGLDGNVLYVGIQRR
jgi:hypothetical protein